MRSLPVALLLLGTLALPAVSARSLPSSRERATAWLWSQQEADGGWHSKTYGLLRSGQSLTPFVLLSLLELDPAPQQPERVDRALVFLKAHTAADGSLGRMDDYSQDYPNYATALAVRAIVKAKRPGFEVQIGPMVTYLRLQQFVENNGWDRFDPAYGAWGMGGERLRPPGTGHVDLSMTRHVLQALRDAGVAPDDSAFTKASVYLSRLQNPDGGFFFSTTEEDTNKAGGHKSYGTATADGVLAMLAIGVRADDRQVQKAWGWLTANHKREDRIPGFTGQAYERWHRGLAFYYAAALGELGRMPGFHVLHVRLPEPAKDGHFQNPENLVKEDDPLIATVFGMRAR